MKVKKDENRVVSVKGVTRRGFLQGVGLGSGVIGSGILVPEKTEAATVVGPGPTTVTLKVNGKSHSVTLEPRVTLLDALRNYLHITGPKRVCDRGTCGACTVMVDGKAVYACSVLAIEVQGSEIVTSEGLADQKHPIVEAFVNNDALQCGYCTPGFVVAAAAFLRMKPNPTYEEVKEGLGGNLCRCGTYMGIRRAVLEAAKKLKA